MKVYDLKGCIVKKRMAVIAISLPVATKGNSYFCYAIHYVSKNKILIHFKDFTGTDFTGTSDNLEPFIIDLKDSKFDDFDFSKKIGVVLCHENNDHLKGTPEEIFNSEMNKPISVEANKSILVPNTTGNGTIREE